MFGPCGSGWGHTEIEHKIEDGVRREDGNCSKTWHTHVEVWYIDKASKLCKQSHWGATQMQYFSEKNNRWIEDEDAAKKSRTDGMVKAMSQIGSAADIFLGYYDRNGYKDQVGELLEEDRKADDEARTHHLSTINLRQTLTTGGCVDDTDAAAIFEWASGQRATVLQVESTKGWPAAMESQIKARAKLEGIKLKDLLITAKGQVA